MPDAKAQRLSDTGGDGVSAGSEEEAGGVPEEAEGATQERLL